MFVQHCFAGVLAGAMLAAPACALANEPEYRQTPSGDTGTAPSVTRAAAPADNATRAQASSAQPPLGTPAAAGELESARGGNGGVAEAMLSGAVSGNAATQVATGNNVIQSGSFANASGLPVVIQNSGANVLIQNATVINLELK